MTSKRTERKTFHIYRHECRKTHWVIDPPGFDTRGAAGWKQAPNVPGWRPPPKGTPRRESEWRDAGGRIIKGFAGAHQHLNELFRACQQVPGRPARTLLAHLVQETK